MNRNDATREHIQSWLASEIAQEIDAEIIETLTYGNYQRIYVEEVPQGLEPGDMLLLREAGRIVHLGSNALQRMGAVYLGRAPSKGKRQFHYVFISEGVRLLEESSGSWTVELMTRAQDAE